MWFVNAYLSGVFFKQIQKLIENFGAYNKSLLPISSRHFEYCGKSMISVHNFSETLGIY